MSTNPNSERPPLIGCNPYFLLVVILGLVLYLAWMLIAPHFDNLHAPDAAPRTVTPRGDLAADEKATIELFDSSSSAVVHIMTWENRQVIDRYRLRALEVPRGTGSGFVWDERGYIVTNVHVLENSTRYLVTLSDGSEWEGNVAWGDRDHDIAVLKIDAPREKLHPLAIGTSKDLKVGQKVFAIGNPFGLDHTLTTGIISGLNREIVSDPSRDAIQGVIQTDAAINPGNSGGPLLDSSGRLIGMNTAIYSPSGASAGVGFAVPVDTINAVVPRLIRVGDVEPPKMGVTLAPDAAAKSLGIEGVLVEDVARGSPAEKAGLKPAVRDARARPVGDVITAIDGQTIKRYDDLLAVLNERKKGDVVQIEFVRDGKKQKASLKLQ